MRYGIKVKRIEPVPGNSFTADWTSTIEERCIGNWIPDTHQTRPSTVAEFDIELNLDEVTAAVNGYWTMLEDYLFDRLKIKLFDNYTIKTLVINGEVLSPK